MHQDIATPVDPVIVYLELSEAIERTEKLGDAIEACLDEAERELEDIRRLKAMSQASDQRTAS